MIGCLLKRKNGILRNHLFLSFIKLEIKELSAGNGYISFKLNEIQFAIKDIENIKLTHHKNRYKFGFYMFVYHGVIASLDRTSGDALKDAIETIG